jgi:hypothetical protein
LGGGGGGGGRRARPPPHPWITNNMSIKLAAIMVVIGDNFMDILFIRYSGVRGGGKCPEEERSTWSGGPVSSGHDANANAWAGRETHTYLYFLHFYQIIFLIKYLTLLRTQNKFILSSQKTLKKKAKILWILG